MKLQMKDQNQELIVPDHPLDEEELEEFYADCVDRYGSVFTQEFEEYGIFIFRSIGRKDFRQIRDATILEDYEKEELICETCVLYPPNFDYANCDLAGLPTQLAQLILDKSLLRDSDQMIKAIHYFRDEFYNSLDDQITCTIHEAFPEYRIDEIENWDVLKTAQFMVQSEYILHNLRGVPMVDTSGHSVEFMPASQAQQQATPQQTQPRQMSMEERFQPVEQPASQPMKMKKGNKLSLTPEKLRELQARYPEIDWANDSVSRKGIDAFKNKNFDDRAIADIPLDGSEDGQNAIPVALRDRFKVIRELD